MNNQILQFQSPDDFSENITISTSENQIRSVSYALVPKKILVEVSKSAISFNFKYPIKEKETSPYCQDEIEIILAQNTKKLLKVTITLQPSSDLKSKLKTFDTVLRYLRLRQLRESVKENYEFAHKFIHYFADQLYDPAMLDSISENIPE